MVKWFGSVVKALLVHWKLVSLVLVPLACSPVLVFYPTIVGRAGYGVLLMACYWSLEVLPIPITSLLPMVIFPCLGVMSADAISKNYMKDGNMLILGSLLLASSVEKCGLHKRIALLVIRTIGTKRSTLMLGFMLPTYMLSMWISNTATTAIMFPVAQAILEQFDTNIETTEDMFNQTDNQENAEMVEIENSSNEEDTDVKGFKTAVPRHSHKSKLFRKGLCLSIAYACNVGGSTTLIGTGTNVVFKQVTDSLYEDRGLESPISFASWMGFWIPGSLISLFFACFWLQVQYVGFWQLFKKDRTPELTKKIKQVIDNEYEKLGNFSFAELLNTCCFGVLACLWITRKSSFVPGWITLFGTSYVRNSSCAIFISVLLFVLPYNRPSLGDTQHQGFLLDWPTACKKVTWGVILLLGGGYALADVSKVSSLSSAVSANLSSLVQVSPLLVAACLSLVVSVLTEFTSNVTTNVLLLPILADLSVRMGLNPLYLMIHGTIASSFAFMLPIATPPNAIVFANGDLRILDMMKSGIVMNLTLLCVLLLVTNTWGMYWFDLGTPPWTLDVQVASTTSSPSTLLNSTAMP